MFRYRLVLASEYPSLAEGKPTVGLLSPREEVIVAGLAHLPRRRKWLLGRAAAKCLVRAMTEGEAPDDPEISVLNQPSGEPFVLLEGRGAWERPISISHRSALGMAAAPIDARARIGADVETVEPRDAALIRQFFTDEEAALVLASAQAEDEVVARIWSAKEAVLKLLGLGLRIDTRGVVVSFAGAPDTIADVPDGWQPIRVDVVAPLPRRDVLDGLCVVWRREAGHVLTVAIAGQAQAAASPP
jgi:4'-phosphopantetheinyl transferase